MRSAFLDWKPDSDGNIDHRVSLASSSPAVYKNPVSGVTVDLSCNETVTVECLQQLYNAVGYVPKNSKGNRIGVTGFLEQYANIEDLNTFYADQVPQAVGTSFEFISVNGEK
jgi:tripeptidyl-peptidase-1